MLCHAPPTTRHDIRASKTCTTLWISRSIQRYLWATPSLRSRTSISRSVRLRRSLTSSPCTALSCKPSRFWPSVGSPRRSGVASTRRAATPQMRTSFHGCAAGFGGFESAIGEGRPLGPAAEPITSLAPRLHDHCPVFPNRSRLIRHRRSVYARCLTFAAPLGFRPADDGNPGWLDARDCVADNRAGLWDGAHPDQISFDSLFRGDSSTHSPEQLAVRALRPAPNVH